MNLLSYVATPHLGIWDYKYNVNMVVLVSLLTVILYLWVKLHAVMLTENAYGLLLCSQVQIMELDLKLA